MQIDERYTSLFSIEEYDVVTLKSDGIIEHLRNSSTDKVGPSESSRAPVKYQSGLDIIPRVEEDSEQFDEAEVAIVQQVIKMHWKDTFGDDGFYNRFGLDSFFKAKARSTRLFASNAHVRLLSSGQCRAIVARSCLTVICDHLDEAEYIDLIAFAWDEFAYHVGDLDDPSITATTKHDIGLKLIQVLREDSCIDAWWTERRLWARLHRLHSDHAIAGVYDWLCDPTVRTAFNHRFAAYAKATADQMFFQFRFSLSREGRKERLDELRATNEKLKDFLEHNDALSSIQTFTAAPVPGRAKESMVQY